MTGRNVDIAELLSRVKSTLSTNVDETIDIPTIAEPEPPRAKKSTISRIKDSGLSIILNPKNILGRYRVRPNHRLSALGVDAEDIPSVNKFERIDSIFRNDNEHDRIDIELLQLKMDLAAGTVKAVEPKSSEKVIYLSPTVPSELDSSLYSYDDQEDQLMEFSKYYCECAIENGWKILLNTSSADPIIWRKLRDMFGDNIILADGNSLRQSVVDNGCKILFIAGGSTGAVNDIERIYDEWNTYQCGSTIIYHAVSFGGVYDVNGEIIYSLGGEGVEYIRDITDSRHRSPMSRAIMSKFFEFVTERYSRF